MSQSESNNQFNDQSDLKHSGADQPVETMWPADEDREVLPQMFDQLCHQQRLNLSTHLGLGLASQINHPLSASVNYAQCCIKMLQEDDFDRKAVQDLLSRSCQESHRASEMIRRLRRFVVHCVPRLSTMNFNHAVLESVALLGSLLKEHQIDLQLNLKEDLPLMIGDRIQIEQVIFNLVINAIQSLADHDICSPLIVLNTTLDAADGDRLMLQVVDNGPGFTEQAMEHRFEPFQTTKPECLGVGLALSRSICKAHGGDIQVRPQSERGCQVCVLLPRTQVSTTEGGDDSSTDPVDITVQEDQ